MINPLIYIGSLQGNIYKDGKIVMAITYESRKKNKSSSEEGKYNLKILFIDSRYRKHRDYFRMLIVRKYGYSDVDTNSITLARKIIKKYGSSDVKTSKPIKEYAEDEKIDMKLALYEKADNGEISLKDRDRLLSLL